MSTYAGSIRKGFLIAVIVLVVDFAVSTLLALIGLSVLAVMGDLLLFEVAFIVIVGGIVEFSKSKGVYEFRKLAFQSEEKFSSAKHKEASKMALVLFTAGVTLFCFLILVALME